ncbi:unnamed protein product, partial [Hapterophycus canaliculatus]
KCWGDNRSGQLGLGHVATTGDESDETGDNLPFVDLGTAGSATSLSLGESHTCAILGDGSVSRLGVVRYPVGRPAALTVNDATRTWIDSRRSLFPSTLVLSSIPMSINRPGRPLFSCERCWGKGFTGQLGRGDFYARGKFPGEMGDGLSIVDLGTDVAATSIAAGSDHTCAVIDDGSLKCWGMNALGALGLGDTNARGDDADEMGDALPAVSLGTGVTVAT